MARFKRNYLPSQSRPWGKQVEDALDAAERNLKTVDVNNRSKDEQFSASLNRLDAAVIDARSASEKADVAQDAAIIANGLASAANTEASLAIQQVVDLGAVGGPAINASNINGGTISGNFINGGVITGTTISGDTISGGTITGTTISADNITGGTLNSPSINGGSISGSSITGGSLTSIGNLEVPFGTILGDDIYGTSNVRTDGYYIGNRNITIGGTTTSSFAGNCFVNSSGYMFRSTNTSSREAKENILSYEFDTDAFIAVNPVTFNYKLDAVQSQEETEINQLGFILEDFEDAGLGEHLIISANEVDTYKGLRYEKLYMMLHKVVQSQDETIKNLTARIEALESN
jgi:hypothetical protein